MEFVHVYCVCIYVCTHVCTRQGTVRVKDEIIREKEEIIREKDKVIKRLKVGSKTQIRLVMRAMFSYLLLLQYHGAMCQGRGVERSAQL